MEIQNETVKINRKDNYDEYNKQYHREYYDRKKADIKANVSIKIPCGVCNKMVQKQHKAKHQKTAACQMHASYKRQLQQQLMNEFWHKNYCGKYGKILPTDFGPSKVFFISCMRAIFTGPDSATSTILLILLIYLF
jgi:hypothetical protein